MKRLFFYLFFTVVSFDSIEITFAEDAEEESSPKKIRICSQNLHRFGEKKNKGAIFNKQLEFLVSRMKAAHCDIIAGQEIFGESKNEAQENLSMLATALKERYARGINGRAGVARKFRPIIGDGIDKYIRNGFLIAEDVGEVESVKDYSRYPVPKLSLSGPARAYPRGPLGVVVRLRDDYGRACDGNFFNRLFLVNIHLKSKVDGWKDPTRTSFETSRMETAEGIREIAANEPFANGALVVIIGDRNSPPGSAAAEVLSGRRLLSDFRVGADCEVTKSLKPDCDTSAGREQEFRALFESRAKKSKGFSKLGSYKYRGKEEILDEILVSSKYENNFVRKDNRYAIGYRGDFYKGSDHKLLWAEVQTFCE